MTGPKWKPTRMAMLLPCTTSPAEMRSCMPLAASAAALGSSNTDITSSPMVFTTRPDWRLVSSSMMETHFATVSRATVSPIVSYSLVLPQTSANRMVSLVSFIGCRKAPQGLVSAPLCGPNLPIYEVPGQSGDRSFLRHYISYPGGVRVAMVHGRELIAALPGLGVGALPPDSDVTEARFRKDLLQFRQGP